MHLEHYFENVELRPECGEGFSPSLLVEGFAVQGLGLADPEGRHESRSEALLIIFEELVDQCSLFDVCWPEVLLLVRGPVVRGDGGVLVAYVFQDGVGL